MIQHTCAALSLVLATVFVGEAKGQVLVPNDSTWRFLHPTDGVDPAGEVEDFHATFPKADFDDSKWKKGQDKPGPHGGFGYGDEAFEGIDIGQPEDRGHRKTAYFRLKFKTDNEYESLALKCQRDDGIIVYLDGKEVVRDNIAKELLGFRTAKEKYDLFAQQTIAGDQETKVNSYPVRIKLPAGEHVLAISLHNRANGSSDLRIAEISLSVESDVESAAESDVESAAESNEPTENE